MEKRHYWLTKNKKSSEKYDQWSIDADVWEVGQRGERCRGKDGMEKFEEKGQRGKYDLRGSYGAIFSKRRRWRRGWKEIGKHDIEWTVHCWEQKKARNHEEK